MIISYLLHCSVLSAISTIYYYYSHQHSTSFELITQDITDSLIMLLIQITFIQFLFHNYLINFSNSNLLV